MFSSSNSPLIFPWWKSRTQRPHSTAQISSPGFFLTHLLPRARVTPALASLSWLSMLSFMPLRSVWERDEEILYLRITEGKKTLWRHTRTRCSSKRTPLCDLELSLLLSQSDPCIFPCGLHTPPFMAEWNLPEQVWLQIHCTVRTIITH